MVDLKLINVLLNVRIMSANVSLTNARPFEHILIHFMSRFTFSLRKFCFSCVNVSCLYKSWFSDVFAKKRKSSEQSNYSHLTSTIELRWCWNFLMRTLQGLTLIFFNILDDKIIRCSHYIMFHSTSFVNFGVTINKNLKLSLEK